MVVPLIPSKTEKWGGAKKFFSALRAEIITTTTVPLHIKSFRRLWSQVYTLQLNSHCQTEETLPILASDYTTNTVV